MGDWLEAALWPSEDALWLWCNESYPIVCGRQCSLWTLGGSWCWLDKTEWLRGRLLFLAVLWFEGSYQCDINHIGSGATAKGSIRGGSSSIESPMQSGETTSSASVPAEEKEPSLVPNQIALLVPTFDPSRDDLQQYVSKVELLVDVWPKNRLNELATRLILGCTGSAFKKLAIHKAELQVNEVKSIQKLIELLGGHWGQVALEKRYECAEKALFRCVQRSDESNDSFLARADIHWSELLARKTSLEEIQAYVILRGSQLSSEDKKRVLLECDAGEKGSLSMDKVSQAIRMLGAGFFQDMVGAKKSRGKVYDGTALATETTGQEEEADDSANAVFGETPTEDDFVEALALEGDEDALIVQDYEGAAVDTVQEDPELAMAYNSYTEARRRLSERFKNRGFWPVSGKGKGKSGKGKGKFSGKGHRKSLQQRMLESNCRLCGKRGHWHAECPERSQMSASGSSNPTAVTTLSVADSAAGLPMEFLELPDADGKIDEPCMIEFNFHSFCWPTSKERLGLIFRNQKMQNPSPALRSESRAVLGQTSMRVQMPGPNSGPNPTSPPDVSLKAEENEPNEDHIHFSTHGSYGILDSGATKSVIGTSALRDLLKNLKPEVRDQLKRCSCKVTFRFGNYSSRRHTILAIQYVDPNPTGHHWFVSAPLDQSNPRQRSSSSSQFKGIVSCWFEWFAVCSMYWSTCWCQPDTCRDIHRSVDEKHCAACRIPSADAWTGLQKYPTSK